MRTLPIGSWRRTWRRSFDDRGFRAASLEAALAGLFGEVLLLCREAGMVKVGVLAVDGTKVAANASSQRQSRL